MAHLNQESLHYILQSAILAPSADNQHSLRFQLIEESIHVYYTKAELPPQGGYKWALVMLSLGTVAENMNIAASRFGLTTQIKLLPEPTQPNLLLQISLQNDGITEDPLCRFIPLRHTNRRVFFRGPKMTDAERMQISTAVQDYPASQLTWLDEPSLRNQALRLMRRAETERFHNPVLHRELFSAIRFDEGWHSNSQEGLPPGALGVEPPLRVFFTALRYWSVMRLLNLFGAHHIMGWRACDLPCRLAPNLGLLSVKNSDKQSVFDTGRAFQRLWLAVTSQGRILQPMPASAVFALDGASGEGVPADLQLNLAENWKNCLHGNLPLMIFRIGFAAPTTAITGRRPLRDYTNAA